MVNFAAPPPPQKMLLAKLYPRNPVHSCLIVLLYCPKDTTVPCASKSGEVFRVLNRNEIIAKRVNKTQLDAQTILSIFRLPLHVSGVSRSIINRYNHVCTPIGTYYSFKMSVVLLGLFQSNQDNRQSSKNSNNKYQFLYTYSCTS